VPAMAQAHWPHQDLSAFTVTGKACANGRQAGTDADAFTAWNM
jgi:hypothetical protein